MLEKKKNINKDKLLKFAKEAKKIQNLLKKTSKDGLFPTINELLKSDIYQIEGEIKTFNQWKKSGKIVKKGEKGYLFFTKPIVADKKKEEEDLICHKDIYDFFGHCYLFSSSQVS
jgi:hypothetical protein